jgi:hypothetical protein
MPSALNTWTMLRFGDGTRNKYEPGGSVTPGNVTGALKVKITRLSRGCAFAGVTVSASKATAQTKLRTILLSMYGLLLMWRRDCRNFPRRKIAKPVPPHRISQVVFVELLSKM